MTQFQIAFMVFIALSVGFCFFVAIVGYTEKFRDKRQSQEAIRIKEAVAAAMEPHSGRLRQLEGLRKFESDIALFTRFETAESAAKTIPARFLTIEENFSKRILAITEEATTTVGRLNELHVTVDSLAKRVDALDIKVFGPRKVAALVKRGGGDGTAQVSGNASTAFVPPPKATE